MRAYEKYKDSGVSWLQGQQIPCGWTTCKLKNTAKSKGCLFIDGDWIESKNIIPDSNIIYTTTGNVGPGYFKYQSLGHISEQTFVDLNCTEVKPGDLVISRLNEPIGRACIFPKLGAKMITAVDNVVLRPDLEKYNKRYLMYQMNSPKYTISANLVARGATMHRISRSMLGDIQLIVPPLYEQEAIANYLDKKTAEIDKIIAEREKKIELLNELKSSIISRAVTKGINPHAKMKDSGIDWIGEIPEGWELCRFKNFMFLITNVTTSGKKIGLENIESGTGKYIYTESEFEGNGVAFKINDIVYGKLRPYLRKVWRADFDGNAVGDFFVFRNKKNSLSSFLKYVLLSDNFTQFANGTTYGAKMPRVASNAILDQQYFLPPLTEQEKISNYLDQKTTEIDYNVSMIRKECILYKEYKQSLISEVVTGKRKVID